MNYDEGQYNNPKLVTIAEAHAFTLADYGLVAQNVKNQMFGIKIENPNTGEPLPDHMYDGWIETAVAKAEKALDVVLLPRYQTEHHDYNKADYNSHMFIHTRTKPIIQVEHVGMSFAGRTVQTYPEKWWRVYNLPGHINMQPTPYMVGQQNNMDISTIAAGLPPILGVPPIQHNAQSAPQIFEVKYISGMLPPARRGVTRPHEMHPDFWTLIMKMSAKEAFQIWGRLIIGAGIAGYRTEIDGFSQQVDTTQSAMYGGASAEIVQLDRDIVELVSSLKAYYGLNLGIIG